ANRLPEAADAYQQQARDPHISRAEQAVGDDPCNPPLDRVAREYTVVCGESREEHGVGHDGHAIEFGGPGPDDGECIGAERESADEDCATRPLKDALERAHLIVPESESGLL